MTNVYTRSALGGGEVKFRVHPPAGNNLLVPAIVGMVFVYLVYKVTPWMPAVLVLASGAYVFYRLRRRLNQIDETSGSFFVASPTGFTIRDRTIPREQIKDVTFLLGSPVGVGAHLHPMERPANCSVHLTTLAGENWPLAIQMHAGSAEGLARGIAEALGGVPVAGEYSPVLEG